MPKIYFRDPGLRNLAMGNFSELHTRADTGQIVEGLVAAQLFRSRSLSQKINYWRSKAGAEVDFVVSNVKPLKAIEFKSGAMKQVRSAGGTVRFCQNTHPEKRLF